MKRIIIILTILIITISSCKKEEFVNDAFINFIANSEVVLDSLSNPSNKNKSYIDVTLFQKNGFENKFDVSRNFELLRGIVDVQADYYYYLEDKEVIGQFDPTKEINATIKVFGENNSEVKIWPRSINYDIDNLIVYPKLICNDSINGTEYNFVIKFKQ